MEPKNTQELLSSWLRSTSLNEAAQYEACTFFSHMHYGLGIPVVVFSTAVASFTLSGPGSDFQQMALALVSFLSALLAGIQTFLGLAERMEKHRKSGAAFAALSYQIEQLAASDLANRSDVQTQLDIIRKNIGELLEQAPAVPQRIWQAETRRLQTEVKP